MTRAPIKERPISATMAIAIAHAVDHGGELVRYVGGFWSQRDAPRHPHNGNPVDYFGAGTIQALVDREIMAYSEWKDGRGGRFPIAAKFTDAYQSTLGTK